MDCYWIGMIDFPYIIKYVLNNPRQRLGQAYFNAISELHPEITNGVCGTELDPFYYDSRVDDFLNYVSGKLDEKE